MAVALVMVLLLLSTLNTPLFFLASQRPVRPSGGAATVASPAFL